MDGSVSFEEAADATIAPARLEILAVLPGEKWCSQIRELEEKWIERSAQQGIGLDDRRVHAACAAENSGCLSIAFKLAGTVIWIPGTS